MRPTATALIAEDEPLLALSLRKMLRDAWPELSIVAEAGDGESAIVRALDATPDVLFLDIRMPGKTGLAVAEHVVDEWPEPPAPLIVFVTAYDEFALAAFEREAIDYVLKPVTAERLERTLRRLQQRLQDRRSSSAAATPGGDLTSMFETLQALARTVDPAGRHEPPERIDIVHIGHGNSVELVPVADVLFFEATDKYVAVHTRMREGLIRLSMRELMARLDPRLFMQVHRSVAVNRRQIASAIRDDSGRVTLKLRDSPREIAVSRAFAQHFRAM